MTEVWNAIKNHSLNYLSYLISQVKEIGKDRLILFSLRNGAQRLKTLFDCTIDCFDR